VSTAKVYAPTNKNGRMIIKGVSSGREWKKHHPCLQVDELRKTIKYFVSTGGSQPLLKLQVRHNISELTCSAFSFYLKDKIT
jgi:hypothetical protein